MPSTERRTEIWRAAGVFALCAAIYLLSSVAAGQQPLQESRFPHYIRLAESLLRGRLDVTDPLPEVAVREGKTYIIESLGPALFMAPFVALWGPAFSDVLFLILIGALNAALVFSLWPKVARASGDSWPVTTRYWLTMLFALGTPHWYLSIAGRVWHTEGVLAVCWLLLALHEALGRRRFAWVGCWLGLAAISYPPAGLSLPCFLLLCGGARLREGLPLRRVVWSLADGVCVLGAIVGVGWAWYNFARFGTPFETGLTYIYREDVAQGLCPPYGLMSVRYMPRNAWIALLRLPLPLTGQFPFFALSSKGNSLLWATPAFCYAAWAFRARPLALAAWSAVVPIFWCVLMYHSPGSAQFGYRRIIALLPFLMMLTSLGMASVRWKGARALIAASVAINGVGALWFYAVN